MKILLSNLVSSLAKEPHGCCFSREKEGSVYSAAFSGSGAVVSRGASAGASFDSVVAAPLSPPAGASASDEVQRVWVSFSIVGGLRIREAY